MHFLHPPRHVISGGASAVDQLLPARIFAFPKRKTALAQEILVIQAQFFHARPRHIGQLDFGFLRGAGSLAALGDVLDTRPRRLHHLIVCAAAMVDIALAETNRHVKNQLRDLKTLQISVAAMLLDQGFVGRHNCLFL
jgi:hypothetical protein